MSYYVVLRGPLGVGKTTISARLSDQLGADHILIDRILEEEGLEEWDEDRISLKSFLRANEFVVARVRGALKRHSPSIVDGCFYWKEQLDDLVEKLHAPHYVFSLVAPLEVCVERDRTRPLPEKGTGPRGGDQQGKEAAAAVYQLVSALPYGIEIRADGSLDATVLSILGLLPMVRRRSRSERG
jgi:adenylate kinase family enzyme